MPAATEPVLHHRDMRKNTACCISLLLACAHRPSPEEQAAASIEENERRIAETSARNRQATQEKETERVTGQIVTKESMGRKATVLEGMIVPVDLPRATNPVYTLALHFVRIHDSPNSVFASFSPYFVWSGLGHYLNCSRLGLWRDKSWTTIEAKEGSDGWWVVVESDHDLGTSGSHLDEVVAATLPVTLLSELVATDRSGAQVCEDKFELSAEQKALLQEFLTGPLPAAESKPPS